jgi:hypothetical protein
MNKLEKKLHDELASIEGQQAALLYRKRVIQDLLEIPQEAPPPDQKDEPQRGKKRVHTAPRRPTGIRIREVFRKADATASYSVGQLAAAIDYTDSARDIKLVTVSLNTAVREGYLKVNDLGLYQRA